MFRLPVHAGIACLVALLLFTAQSHAVPISYNEAVSGDLSNENPLTLFTLDIGANTISGTVSNHAPFDFDGFAFTVPAGMSVTGGNVTLADLTGNIDFAAWSLATDTLWNAGTQLAFLNPSSPGSVSIPALPAGNYNISQIGLGSSAGGPPTASYTFTFNVTPEPASLSILALGIVPLLRRSRIR